VQNPHEADYPSMPTSACRYVDVDIVCPLAEIAPRVMDLIKASAELPTKMIADRRTAQEVEISQLNKSAIDEADRLGTPSPFICPACGGVLAEYYDDELLRFRCQVGHAFSPASLFAKQAENLDETVWAAFRALDERANLASRLTQDAQRQQDRTGELRFRQLRIQAEAQKERLRQALVGEHASDSE
jgi:two-component system, chemotaxis family, protein-glutamate methylesterase/glutaminase